MIYDMISCDYARLRDEGTLLAIRTKLKEIQPDQLLCVKCFNEEEIEFLKSRLSKDELSRIAEFTYLTWEKKL